MSYHGAKCICFGDVEQREKKTYECCLLTGFIIRWKMNFSKTPREHIFLYVIRFFFTNKISKLKTKILWIFQKKYEPFFLWLFPSAKLTSNLRKAPYVLSTSYEYELLSFPTCVVRLLNMNIMDETKISKEKTQSKQRKTTDSHMKKIHKCLLLIFIIPLSHALYMCICAR